MNFIEKSWFDERVKDEISSRDQAEALNDYLNSDAPVDETAKTLTAAIDRAAKADGRSAEDVVEQLCLLWTFILDVVSDWPQMHSKVMILLDTFRKLPPVDQSGKDDIESFCDDTGVVREAVLWQDLPKFWNLFSDNWDAHFAWRKGGQRSDIKDTGSPSWSNINAFAAIAFKSEAFSGMRFLGDRGCLVLDESAASNSDLVNVDIPAAAGWIRIAGPELYTFYTSNLNYSSPGQWTAWQTEFSKIASNTGIREFIRNDAAEIVTAMHNVGYES